MVLWFGTNGCKNKIKNDNQIISGQFFEAPSSGSHLKTAVVGDHMVVKGKESELLVIVTLTTARNQT